MSSNPSQPATNEETIAEVKAHYRAAAMNADGCCDTATGASDDRWGAARYDDTELANVPTASANLSMGCGNPYVMANLSPGEHILDLGSGGGLDVILSAKRVGPQGKAYGVDFLDEMIEIASANAKEAEVDNAEFLAGTIESVPLPDSSIDVVISNCVINLAADKSVVFAEMARVMRSNGRIAISDVVAENDFSPTADGTEWAECGIGALRHDDYITMLQEAGFENVTIDYTHETGPGLHGAIIRADHDPA